MGRRDHCLAKQQLQHPSRPALQSTPQEMGAQSTLWILLQNLPQCRCSSQQRSQ